VIATGRLMRRGILLKSGTALERLANADTIVFDKTGTLTLGLPTLIDCDRIPREVLELAAGIARSSTHPLARALVRAAPDAPAIDGVREVPGCGLAVLRPEGEIRLGSRDWCGVSDDLPEAGMELWLAHAGTAPLRFGFADAARPDAGAVIATLKRRGYRVQLLSGDRAPAVAALAAGVGIDEWRAHVSPAEKTEHLRALARTGAKVLMVGDGLNDAPALAAAHVSLSPASAADISQTAADVIFQGEPLSPVIELIDTAQAARRLVRQNIAAAVIYNFVAVPVAVLGLLTPFLAAIAMSSSSLAVVGNALRLSGRRMP
jgi:Cu2+-exporting ATPase